MGCGRPQCGSTSAVGAQGCAERCQEHICHTGSWLWPCVWVGIHFGSVLYVQQTPLCKLPAIKSVVSRLAVCRGAGLGVGRRWGGPRSCLRCAMSESSVIKPPQQEQRNKSLWKLAWDKDLKNLLFIFLKSPWRWLLLGGKNVVFKVKPFFPLFLQASKAAGWELLRNVTSVWCNHRLEEGRFFLFQVSKASA